MKEIYKDIKGYEGLYRISNLGNVKSLISNKILKNRKTGTNRRSIYYRIALYKNKIREDLSVHRLVASHFIGEIGDKVINHKDLNTLNNNVNNLEIITQRENMIHYHNSDLSIKDRKKRKENYYRPVLQYKDGLLIKEWKSVREAMDYGHSEHIYCVISGKRKHTLGGYKWEYKYEK